MNEASPQLSVADGAVHDAVALQEPEPADTVMSAGHPLMAGARASTTVTVALHVAALPAPSVTVSTTVFAPRFAQVKLDLSIDSVTPPHESELPPSTMSGVKVADPDASSASVAALQTAVGASSSTTVTFCWQVAALPAPSVAVQVTNVSPNGNVEGALFVVLATAQLSDVVGDPRATPLALQAPASVPTSTFAGQVMVGTSASVTVTVNEPVLLFPDPSMAV